MKRILILVYALLCLGCLFGCSGGNEEPRDAYGDFVSAIEAGGYNPIHLTEAQVDRMEENIKNLIELDGGVLKVCQLQKNGIFAYVIEFESESDAQKLCDERGAVGLYVHRYGSVAVYGNNEAINELE